MNDNAQNGGGQPPQIPWNNSWFRRVVLLLVAGYFLLGHGGGGGLFHSKPDPVYTVNDIAQLDDARYNYAGSPYYGTKDSLLKKADRAMEEKFPLITDKKTAPPSGDKRDYISQAVYYWQDPANPDGPWIRRDGEKNPLCHDGDRYDADRLNAMEKQLHDLVVGYRLTDDEKYAKRAVSLLETWFVDPATSMRPRLLFAQVIPGKETFKGAKTWQGNHSGVIDSIGLIGVVDDIQLLQKSPSFPKDRQEAVELWFDRYLSWLLTSPMGKKESEAANNHGTWYDAQVAVLARYTGRDKLARKVLEALPEGRMKTQIAADGSLPLELERTRPLHYSLFNLRAYLVLARLGEGMAIHLYDVKTPDGTGLKQSLRYYLPYVKGEKKLPRQDITPADTRPFLKALFLANSHYEDPDFSLLRQKQRIP